MTHDEIMQAAGYSPQTAKAEHYDTATGDTVASADSSRNIIIYEKTGSVYRPDSTPKLRFNAALADELEPGKTYTLEARICYTDESLQTQNPGSPALFTEASVQWDKVAESANITTITPADGATTSIQFTIDAGNEPTQIIQTDYNRRGDGKGLDMTLQLNVLDDVSYNTGVFLEDGQEAKMGVYKVKIVDRADSTDVTDQFTSPEWGTNDPGKPYLSTNGLRTLTWSGNTNYGHQYRVEIWGTLNGIHHLSGTACSCGMEHGEADEYGNILLASSDENTAYQNFLTMPDATGIVIHEAAVTYTPATGQLRLQVLSGNNCEDLTGAATVTIAYDGGNKSTTVSAAGVAWSNGSCSFTVDPEVRDEITGTCSATYLFRTADGETYTHTWSFIVTS